MSIQKSFKSRSNRVQSFSIQPDIEDNVEEVKRLPPPIPIKLSRTKSFSYNEFVLKKVPVLEKESDVIPRISCDTFKDLILGNYNQYLNELLIIDCRFLYEFNGGHIKGATHIGDPSFFIHSILSRPKTSRLVVFHCEFSKNRSVSMAQILREFDRRKSSYPNLIIPDICILDKGYKLFYELYPDFCDGGYVEMNSKPYNCNGVLAACNTEFSKNIENLKSEIVIKDYENPKAKRSSYPESPARMVQGKSACLLSSPLPVKKR